MRQMLLKCPSCSGQLTARRLECPSCQLSIDSAFEFPSILKLTRSQLDFVEVFVKNRGVIRDVERELGVSYPTVRARLDEVIAALGFSVMQPDAEEAPDDDAARRAVLNDLREGRISPEDALRLLRKQTDGTASGKGGQPQ
jgi:hypothetical protein